ncbi:hypothetical protein F5I97DRAFT_1901913 [Phlebopus sp. FC_14]|nr:hypothetical protein F5I97DRAFT_1901913 [Phlebopus sp. FC_14]
MDSRRAETLQALSDYIQNQKSLLARTRTDIERLKQLKGGAYASPSQPVNGNASELLNPVAKFSELQDHHPTLSFPDKINWDVFSSSDATPLRTLAIRTRLNHTQCSVPHNAQRSPLSTLQKFVKDARKIILDPVLGGLPDSVRFTTNLHSDAKSNLTSTSRSFNDPNFALRTLSSSLSENETDEEQSSPPQESLTATRKRERARAKIRELKKRKIRPDEVVACGLGNVASDAVFVRHDVEDETLEVDVSMETARSLVTTIPGIPQGVFHVVDASDKDCSIIETPSDTSQNPMQPDLPSGPSPALHRPVPPQTHSLTRSSRTRKPSLKLQHQPPHIKAELDSEEPVTPTPSQLLGKRTRDMTAAQSTPHKPKAEPLSASTETNVHPEKSRSDTYKQAWSISEQHLLERLLEEIPDGERNRWAKISQAMGGRRTPRQVASRVQKYFEKLKRFGVSVDNRAKAVD